MENERQNMQKSNPEKGDDDIPSLLEVEERLANVEDKPVFACPECQTEVANDSVTCPGCGAVFEEVPGSETREKEDNNLPSIADLSEGKEGQYEPKEIPKIFPMKRGETEYVPEVETERYENRLDDSMDEYYDRRKKRYLFGALSLGIGIVMFVLLWLVVVNLVLVAESEEVFGLPVVALLAAGSVFFITGLYLTLTYPSSSLSKLLATMAVSVDSQNPDKPR